MATDPISVHLDDHTKSRLEDLARAMDRPVPDIAKEAIKEYLLARDAKQIAIGATVSQADQGRFVSSAATRAWLKSLGSEDELPRPKP